jgi:hypothetical protein
MEPPWNSLEIAKLVVAVATPVAVIIIGLFVQRTLARQDRLWKARQRLGDRRLAVYDEIRKELNRIYCFVNDVGTWKDETPATVVKHKRHVDGVMHANRAVWSPETFSAYLDYMQSAFAVFQGVGVDARIRTTAAEKRVGIPGWQTEWESGLTGEVDSGHNACYTKLVDRIARDLFFEASDLDPSART